MLPLALVSGRGVAVVGTVDVAIVVGVLVMYRSRGTNNLSSGTTLLGDSNLVGNEWMKAAAKATK